MIFQPNALTNNDLLRKQVALFSSFPEKSVRVVCFREAHLVQGYLQHCSHRIWESLSSFREKSQTFQSLISVWKLVHFSLMTHVRVDNRFPQICGEFLPWRHGGEERGISLPCHLCLKVSVTHKSVLFFVRGVFFQPHCKLVRDRSSRRIDRLEKCPILRAQTRSS